MKKIIVFLFLICSFLTSAQMRYSTRNKGAIKLFKKAMEAPSKSIDPNTGMPDYQAGIDLLDKALKKDPNFWEAHLLAAEFDEYKGDNSSPENNADESMRRIRNIHAQA